MAGGFSSLVWASDSQGFQQRRSRKIPISLSIFTATCVRNATHVCRLCIIFANFCILPALKIFQKMFLFTFLASSHGNGGAEEGASGGGVQGVGVLPVDAEL